MPQPKHGRLGALAPPGRRRKPPKGPTRKLKAKGGRASRGREEAGAASPGPGRGRRTPGLRRPQPHGGCHHPPQPGRAGVSGFPLMNGGREGRSRAPSHAAAEPPLARKPPEGRPLRRAGGVGGGGEIVGLALNRRETSPPQHSLRERGSSLLKYCKVTPDRLPHGDFFQKTDGRNSVNKMFFRTRSSGERPPRRLPGKSLLVPKLPLRTEKRVQKAFPLHRNLIMAWLHLLGFIHFYCSFHCPLLPDVFMKPESNLSGEGVLDPGHLRLKAAVKGGQ